MSQIAITLIAGVVAFLLGRLVFGNLQEALFWAVIVGIGLGAFMLTKSTVSVWEKLRSVAVWDIAAPILLISFVTWKNAQADLVENLVRLCFALIFFVGLGTACRLAFRRR